MAVASILTQKNINPIALDTEATLTMEGLSIKNIHLSIIGLVPEITAADFIVITKEAEKNCLISKILNIPIISEAYLKS